MPNNLPVDNIRKWNTGSGKKRELTTITDSEKTVRDIINESRKNAEEVKKGVIKVNAIWQKGLKDFGEINKAIREMGEEVGKMFSNNLKEVANIMSDATAETISKITAQMTKLEKLNKDHQNKLAANKLALETGLKSYKDIAWELTKERIEIENKYNQTQAVLTNSTKNPYKKPTKSVNGNFTSQSNIPNISNIPVWNRRVSTAGWEPTNWNWWNIANEINETIENKKIDGSKPVEINTEAIKQNKTDFSKSVSEKFYVTEIIGDTLTVDRVVDLSRFVTKGGGADKKSNAKKVVDKAKSDIHQGNLKQKELEGKYFPLTTTVESTFNNISDWVQGLSIDTIPKIKDILNVKDWKVKSSGYSITWNYLKSAQWNNLISSAVGNTQSSNTQWSNTQASTVVALDKGSKEDIALAISRLDWRRQASATDLEEYKKKLEYSNQEWIEKNINLHNVLDKIKADGESNSNSKIMELENNHSNRSSMVKNAKFNNELDLLKWVHEKEQELARMQFENWNKSEILENAKFNNELDSLKKTGEQAQELSKIQFENWNKSIILENTEFNNKINLLKKTGEQEQELARMQFENRNALILKDAQAKQNSLDLIDQESKQTIEKYKAEQLSNTNLETYKQTSNANWLLEIKNLQKEKKKQDKEDRKNRLATYKERKKNYKDEIEQLESKKASVGQLSQEEQDRLDQARQGLAEAESQQKSDSAWEIKSNLLNKLGIDDTSDESLATQIANKLAGPIDSYMDSFSQYQRVINTRLQGTTNNFTNMRGKIYTSIGVNPWVKMDDILENINDAIEKGIAYNVEQRAFLQTVKESVASTFDAFNSNLLQIIRVQQADTTASRLGMESALTQFFNGYFSDSSYLTDVGTDSITSSLSQAISQMGAEESVAVEYQVNKWLGSLYSVGFSSEAVNSIADALGDLGSGNISSLSSNESMQNLLVMAMSRAGLSYSDFLINGLDSSNTNKLMKSMVEYLSEISQSTNQVVKSEYASIFGMTVSDLKAVENLVPSINSISKSSMNYSSSLKELYNQMSLSTQFNRYGATGMIDNLYDNMIFSMASTFASTPVTGVMYKLATLVKDVAGGVAIPAISVFGNMIDLETTVADVINYSIAGVGLLGGLNGIFMGLSSSWDPSSMLNKLGIKQNSLSVLQRGTAKTQTSGESTVSRSNTIGNSSGSDVSSSVTTQAQSEGQEKLDVKEEEEDGKTTTDIYSLLYETFNDLMNGSSTFSVNVKNTVDVNIPGGYGYSSDAGL